MRFHLLCLSLAFYLFSASCTKKPGGNFQASSTRSPEEVVKEFIDKSVHSTSVDDRRFLQDLCAGEMKRAFERMSDEEFRASYLSNELKLQGIKILNQTVESDVARVHYQVSVQNGMGTDPTQEYNEREVELKLSQGAWYIEYIRPKGVDKLAFTRGMIF